MSDKTETKASNGIFTEREVELLSFAMRCLKSGPPDVCLPLLYTHQC
jgi:hypothetical protein